MTREQLVDLKIEGLRKFLAATVPLDVYANICMRVEETIRSLALPVSAAEGPRPEDEEIARHVHGLIEAGEMLFQHAQRIDWDPAAANMARSCWLESVAALNGDTAPKPFPPAPDAQEVCPRCNGRKTISIPTGGSSIDPEGRQRGSEWTWVDRECPECHGSGRAPGAGGAK
jgi:hypothetical protein